MTDSNLAQIINFQTVRDTFPEIAGNKSEVNRVYRKAKEYILKGYELDEALKIGLLKKIRKVTSRKGHYRTGSVKLARNQEDIFTESREKTSIITEPSSEVTELRADTSIFTEPSSGATDPNSIITEPVPILKQKEQLIDIENLGSNHLKEPEKSSEPLPLSSEPTEPKITEPEVELKEPTELEPKIREFWFRRIVIFIGKLFGGWADILINLIASPAILLNILFIAAFTGILVYLQKDFYMLEEGRSEIVAYIIAGLSELGLIILVFIRVDQKMTWIKNALLGVLFLYVGCCLGFTVWKSATEKRVEINSSIFLETESLRLKKSIERAEAARSKVSSRDGATAMENARKNVQLSQSRLDLYSKTHKKIPESLRVNQEANVVFQAVLLILLRLIFMGVNGVLSHSLRAVWDSRDLKLV